MTGTRIDAPWLTAAQLGEQFGLTERAVKERVTKKKFICHWSGGTVEHPRGMRFSPEDIEYNRRTFFASRPAPLSELSEAKIRKGVARLRRAQALTNSPHSTAA
jgi:hypothetical protein